MSLRKKYNSTQEKPKLKVSSIVGRIAASLGTMLLIILIFLMGVILIVEFGPSTTARNLFVNSAMESSAGKFMATLFFSDEKIAEIRSQNSVQSSDAVTDSGLITISNNIVAAASDDEIITVEEISGSTYKGYLAKIKDPSRVQIGISGEFGDEFSGKTVTEQAESYGAILATNGGGFVDPNGTGNGGKPIGIVINQGKIVWGSASETYEIIGFDYDNKLVVGSMTGQQALDRGVRDALSFGPILVVNGEPSAVNGSGSGLNPRTAIGQCADGTVLLVVIDGRSAASLGASYADLINIMLENGAVNAANLDGGSSSMMYYKGEIINNCSSLIGDRGIPTSVIVK
jgi:exopolysaccharide biosynthesis protein